VGVPPVPGDCGLLFFRITARKGKGAAMEKKKRWESTKFTDDTPDGECLRRAAMRYGALEVKGAKKAMQKQFEPYISSFESWKRYNGDLSADQHIKAIMHHSERVGALQLKLMRTDDWDLVVGYSEAINYHEACIKLHRYCALGLEPRYPFRKYCYLIECNKVAYDQYEKDNFN